MPLWRFLDYITQDGHNLIREWHEGQDDDSIRARFDATLAILGATEDWTARGVEEFKVLTGAHIGLSEIRINMDVNSRKRRFRPVGIWSQEERYFIFLLGCEKSGRIYMPANAFNLALDYKAQYERGIGGLCEHV